MYRSCFHGLHKIKIILRLKIMAVTATYPPLAKSTHLLVIVSPLVAQKMKSIGFVPNTRHVTAVLPSKRQHLATDSKILKILEFLKALYSL